jgi:hypothetical protein
MNFKKYFKFYTGNKVKIDQQDYIKLKLSCCNTFQHECMYHILRVRRQPIEWKNIFVNHINNKKQITCQVQVAHAYNPSYLGGREQEDRSSKPAWANSS